MVRRPLLATASLWGLLLAGACSDQNLGRFNTPPQATITSPATGSSAMAGSRLVLRGASSDTDDQAADLSATWFAADTEICAPNAPADDGTSTCELVVPDTLTLEVRLEVTDGDGAAGSASVLVTVIPNAAPTVEVTAPTSGEVVNEGENLLFAAVVTDNEDAASDLWLTWETDIDGVIHAGAPDSSGVAQFFANDLTAGERALTVTVTDTAGFFSSALGTFTVNALPSAPVVSLAPASPLSDDDLTVSIDAPSVDPDGDAVTYTYAWTVGGAASTASTSSSLPASATARDEVWGVSVTANDAYGASPVATASVVIGNTAPTLTGLALTPDPAFEDDVLACAAGALADADGDAVSLSYDWIVNGAALGDNTDTLEGSHFDRGDIVACIATPSDSASDGAARTSNAVTVSNSAPSVASVAITPSDATASSLLSCSYTGFVDADSDADQSTYEWTVGGSLVGVGSTLSGAFVGADTVVCTVTPFDGTDTGLVVATSLTVENSTPVLASVALTPTAATESDTLVCTPGSTVDDDGTTSFTFTYAWTVNGSAIGATANTLTGSSFSAHDELACWVTPDDGSGASNASGAGVASNTVEIKNTAPVVTSVSVAPLTVRTADTLTASVVASDLDGDSLTYEYAWFVDGTPAGSSSSTLDGSAYFDKGQAVYVVVTPEDGESAGAAAASAAVTVANTAPTAPSVAITPSGAVDGDDLTCSVTSTSTDADGDVLTYSFEWEVDGVAYGGGVDAAESSTVNGVDVFAEEAWTCRSTASDGSDFSPGGEDTVTVVLDSWRAVSAGLHHTCGIDSDWAIQCWGWDGWGQATPPTGTFTSVSAGFGHTCALDAGGAVECWGYDDSGQSTPPSGSFVAVSAGGFHTCAIDSSSAIQCWGYDEFGQATPPSGSFSAVTAGTHHTCALDTAGSVQCWGADDSGQSTPPVGSFSVLSAGDYHNCAIDGSGTIECWGWDNSGQASPPTGAFTAVDGGEFHSCALDGAGAVECWGYDLYGQATAPSGTFTSVTAGGYHACGIDDGGDVQCWGYDAYGQATPP